MIGSKLIIVPVFLLKVAFAVQTCEDIRTVDFLIISTVRGQIRCVPYTRNCPSLVRCDNRNRYQEHPIWDCEETIAGFDISSYDVSCPLCFTNHTLSDTYSCEVIFYLTEKPKPTASDGYEDMTTALTLVFMIPTALIVAIGLIVICKGKNSTHDSSPNGTAATTTRPINRNSNYRRFSNGHNIAYNFNEGPAFVRYISNDEPPSYNSYLDHVDTSRDLRSDVTDDVRSNVTNDVRDCDEPPTYSYMERTYGVTEVSDAYLGTAEN